MNKFQNASLQVKISSVYIISNIFIMMINIILIFGINMMSNRLDTVYQDNLHLNEFSDVLDGVQDSMSNYLSSKTTDALDSYYRSQQSFQLMVQNLNENITDSSFERVERSIRNMSTNYLEEVEQVIEAKRGRNVEKYRTHYEVATDMYGYINTSIESLNTEQFKFNSMQYRELIKYYRLFETVSIITIILVVIANTGLILGLTGAIIQPLKNLAQKANDVGRGDFDIELPKAENMDEIGIVTGAFNRMVVSIREYIEQIKVSIEAERTLKEKELMMETHLKDARLKYLQAQINPHFLFNTLNAGAQLAMMEGSDRTYEYIQKMAAFYRYNMQKCEENVTIRDEIEMVDSYIYILNVRFAGEINYEKNVDEHLLNTEIPGMILQPIVENSVNHGIREMSGKGKISLNVYEINGEVCIEIKDNGKGMDKKTIDKILDGTYRAGKLPPESNGVGMDNVISRMRLFTDNEDVIEIHSDGENCGTGVVIYIQKGERVCIR